MSIAAQLLSTTKWLVLFCEQLNFEHVSDLSTSCEEISLCAWLLLARFLIPPTCSSEPKRGHAQVLVIPSKYLAEHNIETYWSKESVAECCGTVPINISSGRNLTPLSKLAAREEEFHTATVPTWEDIGLTMAPLIINLCNEFCKMESIRKTKLKSVEHLESERNMTDLSSAAGGSAHLRG